MDDIKNKIVSLSTLQRHVKNGRKKRKAIAFTNGCFDILHYGHVSYLQKAKKKNRILIVGLNSDASVRRIKGQGRPINLENERAYVLAALACVDYVVIFEQDTPYETIKALKPDILIKGADWKGKTVVGEDLVLKSKGKVEFVEYLPNFSTTKTIELIRDNAQSRP